MLASHQPIQKVQQITITESHADQRLDNFLFTFLRGVPKSRVYRIIRKGEIRVNKRRVTVSYRLVLGDCLRIPPIRLADKPEQPIVGSKLTKTLEEAILYEDDHLLIIDKPSGLAVHGGSGISLGLIEALRGLRSDAPFLELVHRIDRDTSGCVMIAKKRSMLTHLHQCLLEGTIQKQYCAITKDQWRGGKIVEAPLLKYLLKSGERMVKVDPLGKFAQTGIKVLESNPRLSLLQVAPVTGRTHQIRVHCAFMGHPIVGDPKYGDPAFNNFAKEQGFERLFLHAHRLVIPMPGKREPLTITASLPDAFQAFFATVVEK